ncbi:hypothetical protein ACE6H2_009489 [Prunus campanulata]
MCRPNIPCCNVVVYCCLVWFRYESSGFFNQPTLPGSVGVCGNKNASQSTAFSAAARKLLMDLQLATPKINGFFAATKNEVVGSGSGNETVYGVAQCAETISKTGCQDCLKVANDNLQSCLLLDTDGTAVDAGCFLRYSRTSFFPDNQTTNIASFLKTGGNSRKKAIIIGVVVGGVGLLILIVGVFLYFKLSRKPEAARRGDILGATELQGPMNYKYKDLKSATKNFSEENKLGEGGFGDVYRGTLNNGKIVAVKKLAILQSDRAKANFVNEVKLISNVHHRNLIRLLGCCSKGPEGYTAPEYAIHGQLSEKVDTYSYGVVVLEIISGQKSSEIKSDAMGEFLLEKAWKLYENGKHVELVDPNLDPNEYKPEDVKKIIEIALMCTQPSAAQRPTMSEVIILLKSTSSLENRALTRPVFVDSDKRVKGDTSTSTSSSTSNATVSVSQVSGR